MPQNQTLKGSLRKKPTKSFWRVTFIEVDKDPVKATARTDDKYCDYIGNFIKNQSDEKRLYLVEDVKDTAQQLVFQPFNMEWVCSISFTVVILCHERAVLTEEPRITSDLKKPIDDIEMLFAVTQ